MKIEATEELCQSPASLLTLPEVFQDRLFSIPDYQRSYSWDGAQIKALHQDLEQLFCSAHLHFTGTIVLVKNRFDLRNQSGCGIVYDTAYSHPK